MTERERFTEAEQAALMELIAVFDKFDLDVGACGCCSSPWLSLTLAGREIEVEGRGVDADLFRRWLEWGYAD